MGIPITAFNQKFAQINAPYILFFENFLSQYAIMAGYESQYNICPSRAHYSGWAEGRMNASLPLFIEHNIDGAIIPQRPTDGYINATALCKKADKLFADYRRLKTTDEYLEALAASERIPKADLVQILRGGDDAAGQGTWVHPKVAINLAQWLSPAFAVQVSDWVFDWMSGNVSGYMPDHVRRYMANRAKIPHKTHFSMLNEVFLCLYAPMEDVGYKFNEKMMPDISTGRIFSDFLREQGIDPETFPTYEHVFTDGRKPVVDARLYPNKHLSLFREHFEDVWLPQKAVAYFKKADPKGLPYLKEAFRIEVVPKLTKKK